MAIMKLVFQNCHPLNIARLIKFSGLGGRLAGGISLDRCCQDHPGLADQIKQVPGARELLVKPVLSSDFYLQGSEAKLLYDVCNFEVTETPETIIGKIYELKQLLLVDGTLDDAPRDSLLRMQGSEAVLPFNGFNPCKNIDFIKVICSFLPLESLSNYAMTCQSAFLFLMNDRGVWLSFASAQGIGLDSSEDPKLKVMSCSTSGKAKSFENKFLATGHHKFSDTNADDEAFKWYIKAASLGNVEARERLKCYVVSAQKTINSQLWITLGDIYSKENADEKLINQCYKNARKILFLNAEKGDPEAVQSLYDRSVGEKPASKINQILDNLLLNQINTVSSQGPKGKKAKDWILRVFSSLNLPLSYMANKEKSLLAVLQTIKFRRENENALGDDAWNLFRHHFDQGEGIRAIVEARLNKMLGMQDAPVKVHYHASLLNHETYVIHLTDKRDNDRFAEAVKNHSALAGFFSPSTRLGRGLTFTNCLYFTKESWPKFTALLSKGAV